MTPSDSPEAVPEGAAPRRLAVLSWITFDIVTTVFHLGVSGLFFPLWARDDLGGDDASIGNTIAIAMALMLFIAPTMGALSDQSQRRIPFVLAGTVVCVGSTLLLGFTATLGVALMLFAAGMIAANAVDIFYGALLPNVTTEESQGRISGIAIGLGYCGGILVILLGLTLVEDRGYEFGFQLLAGLMALVSLPLFLFLRESSRPIEAASTRARGAFLVLLGTLRGIGRFPDFPRFLLARFWYSWGVNTASLFAVLYATDTVGLSVTATQLILVLGIVAAIPSGPAWGYLVDRFGPKKTMTAVLFGWIIAIGSSAAIPSLGLPSSLWWAVGVFSGVLVAGVWATDRPFMIRLSPPSHLGQLMGLSNTTGRLSGIAGPFMWGYIAVTLGMGQIASVVSLAVCIVFSLLLLRGIEDHQRTDDDIGDDPD